MRCSQAPRGACAHRARSSCRETRRRARAAATRGGRTARRCPGLTWGFSLQEAAPGALARRVVAASRSPLGPGVGGWRPSEGRPQSGWADHQEKGKRLFVVIAGGAVAGWPSWASRPATENRLGGPLRSRRQERHGRNIRRRSCAALALFEKQPSPQRIVDITWCASSMMVQHVGEWRAS